MSPGMVVHAFNPSPEEVNASYLREFQTRLIYIVWVPEQPGTHSKTTDQTNSKNQIKMMYVLSISYKVK